MQRAHSSQQYHCCQEVKVKTLRAWLYTAATDLMKGRTRIGILEVDLTLYGRADRHNIHHLSIVGGPCKGQCEHGGASSNEYPHWRLSAAATLQKEFSETSPYDVNAESVLENGFKQHCVAGCLAVRRKGFGDMHHIHAAFCT